MAVDIENTDTNNNLASTQGEQHEYDLHDNSCELDGERNEEEYCSPYEKLSKDLSENEIFMKEFTLGKRIGFYRIQNDIGSGNFAKVKLGYHCLVKEKVAIKILDKSKLDDKTKRLLSQEIAAMEKISHPVIIRIFEVLETLSHVYIVSEYATSGELFHKIVTDGKFPEPSAKNYYAQIVSAVSHLHRNKVIHRDIKAENVFLSGSHCKIGDFGFSTIVASHSQHLNTFCGSPPYAAPELFKDDFYLGKYVDVWALGILLYFMTTGTMPFRADTVGKLKRKILEGFFNVPDHVSSSLRFLLTNIIKLLPKDRLSMPEIMRSDWLEGTPFPQPSKIVSLKPPLLEDDKLSTVEEMAVRQIKSYGITEEMIASTPLTSRNNINGTYRIALYQAERRLGQLERDAMQVDPPNEGKKSTSGTQRTSTRSRFCTLI